MKKTRILKFFKQLNNHEYQVKIIIPLSPKALSNRYQKVLREILIEWLSSPKKIIKKKKKMKL